MKNNYLTLTCLVAAAVAGATASVAQELESWRLKSGPAIEAKLLAWDFVKSTLKVELSDGTVRELPANELHSADMKKIQRILNKQLLAGRKSLSRSESSASYSTKSRSPGERSSLPSQSFPGGAGAFSRAGGMASGNGQAMASGSAGAFVFGSGNSPATRELPPSYPGDRSNSSSDSAEEAEEADEGAASSAVTGTLNFNGQTIQIRSPKDFDRILNELREPRR